jgi:1-acyl-sn-glycerol-3-phosphate acyltransferase
MNDLTALVEDLRGEKAPEQRWDPSQHDQRETGRFE